MAKRALLGVFVMAAIVGVVWWIVAPNAERAANGIGDSDAEESPGKTQEPAVGGNRHAGSSQRDGEKADAGRDAGEAIQAVAESEEEEPKTEEEKREEEEERLVDAFDNLTDEWMEPATNGVSMADVKAFVDQFDKVPRERKEECLQRALNLVPDENVLLLAGVLMDKKQDKELVELVFNDVLNRDETVKTPILKQVYADKTHPCWADVAWIFDVTGENEKKADDE